MLINLWMQYLTMITFNQVSKRYPGGFDALLNVDFSLEKGEMAFLTGHSGAGKSTMLRLIALLSKPTEGEIIVNGQAIHQFKRRELAHYRTQLGIIFQSPHLLQDRSVFDNVALPLLIQGANHQMIVKRVRASLDMVGLLHKEKMFPRMLSFGEQQRVGIARAVVHRPLVLLADEPTGNLDPTLSLDVMKLFEQFSQVGVTVLIASHDIALIVGMKHRIVMLKQGKIC